MALERRQKYFEDILKKQQRQIFKVSRELELHREFLNLQFESFMDFLFQNGGQVIQLPGKNGHGDETGLFFPMKKEKKEGSRSNPDDGGSDRHSPDNENEDSENKDAQKTSTEEEGEGEDLLPPPQAILGSPSPVDFSNEDPESSAINLHKRNGAWRDQDRDQDNERGYNSRRSSQNVVSSSDAQNGNGDGDYDDEVDSSAEYENNGVNGNPEMMKYDMNHFLFSHFLDGGGDEENGVDASYNENDDDDMNIYDGDDDHDIRIAQPSGRSIPSGRQSMSWSNSGGGGRNGPVPNFQQGKPSGDKLPIPASNIPHNERTCRYCGKTFHWKQSWVIHERTHTGEKPYLCKCGKAFSQKSNMNTHAKSCAQAMTTQKGKTTVFQMKCSHCQKMFTHKKNLDLHMEKFHPEVLNLSVKPPSSSSSPTSSVYQNGAAMMEAELNAAAARAAENAAILQILKNATAAAQVTSNASSSKHSIGPAPVSPSSLNHNSNNSNGSLSGGEDRNGRYRCSYCPKRFPVKGTLERHLRVHTGEKPFLCGLCGKAFTQKGSVKLHLERVHRQTM